MFNFNAKFFVDDTLGDCEFAKQSNFFSYLSHAARDTRHANLRKYLYEGLLLLHLSSVQSHHRLMQNAVCLVLCSILFLRVSFYSSLGLVSVETENITSFNLVESQLKV